MSMAGTEDLPLDVVIPVHNERGVLPERVLELYDVFSFAFPDVRFILAENGSTDETWRVLNSIDLPYCTAVQCPVADYGAALRLGLQSGVAPLVLFAEIDFCEIEFVVEGVERLRAGADLVQSSKACTGAVDRRPFIRRAITWGFNHTLRLLFGFGGTDTHGMKLAPRAVLESLLAECGLDGNLLATEMVLRAQRSGLSVAEVAVQITERRQPSIGILRRVPSTFRDLARLQAALRRSA